MKPRQFLGTLLTTAIVSLLIYKITINAVSVTYRSRGTVSFTPSTKPTPPFNPNNPDPDKPVNPIEPNGDKPEAGTVGPLSIDFASSFSFGYQKIVNQDRSYAALAQALKNNDSNSQSYVPNYVQVTDNRGSNAGWTLQVSEDGQMTSDEKTINSNLFGATISLNSPVVVGVNDSRSPLSREVTLNPNGDSFVVMYAQPGGGSGTWINRWGQQANLKIENQAIPNSKEEIIVNVNPSVTLAIPGSTPRDSVKYSTTLTWNLTDIPIIVK